ncbi:hypothetical protein LINPERHAP1_LOCUS39872 [Linum perenne]
MVIGIVGIFGRLLGRGGRGRVGFGRGGRGSGFGRGGRGRVGFGRGGRGRVGFGRGWMLGKGGNTGKGRGGKVGNFGSWRSLRAAIVDSMLENDTAMKRDKKMHKGLEAAMFMLLSLLLS